MAKRTAPLLPATDELLHRFGERLRLARRRRRLTAKQVAERAGMAPMTLRSLERGGPGVTIGAYLAVMQVLGIERDIDGLAKADPLGRELQDARLTPANKAMPRAATALPASPAPVRGRVPATAPKQTPRESAPTGSGWIAGTGFANAETLAGLIDLAPPPANRRR